MVDMCGGYVWWICVVDMCGGHEIFGYAWREKQFMALQFTGSGFQHFCDHMHMALVLH